ncbi:MAG: hypothetical protein KBS53_00750 [Bacteroidales bacterium]|nr:hypothetical protein [Candidatus Hennigimonas equi]
MASDLTSWPIPACKARYPGGMTWPETGNGIDMVRNWEDLDAPIDNWLDVFPFYSGTKAGRVDEIIWTQNDLRKGVMPDDIGRLTRMREFVMLRSGVTNLPQSIGNLKEMMKLSVHDNPLNFRFEDHEGLRKMALASPRFHTLYLRNCGLTGPIPEWLGDLPQKVGGFQPLWDFDYNKLSGQVPDKVAAHSAWNWEQHVDVDNDGRLEIVTIGILHMITQGGGRYALWVGEQPDNVRFVDDADGGHWEWIGENPYFAKEYPEVQ